jgi:prevent-host-death family protein
MDKLGKQKSIAAGQFKQGCLAILDEVELNQIEIVITKRGRPVAKLVRSPVTPHGNPRF